MAKDRTSAPRVVVEYALARLAEPANTDQIAGAARTRAGEPIGCTHVSRRVEF